jgi:hypothetical protein
MIDQSKKEAMLAEAPGWYRHDGDLYCIVRHGDDLLAFSAEGAKVPDLSLRLLSEGYKLASGMYSFKGDTVTVLINGVHLFAQREDGALMPPYPVIAGGQWIEPLPKIYNLLNEE